MMNCVLKINLFSPQIAFGHGDHVGSGKDCGRILELWAREAIGHLKLKELFCGNLEEKSVERSPDDGEVVCEVSEGNLKTLWGPFAILN